MKTRQTATYFRNFFPVQHNLTNHTLRNQRLSTKLLITETVMVSNRKLLKEKPTDIYHCLFDMVEHGCLLPLFPALGHMTPNELELEQNTGFVSLSITPEWKCPCSKAGVLSIYSDHAIACHGWLDAIAKHDAIRDKIVSTDHLRTTRQ